MNKKTVRTAVAITASLIMAGGMVCVPFADTGIAITAQAASSRLAAPAYIICTGKSSDSLTLTWGRVEDAYAYRLYRYDPSSKKYVAVKTVYGTSFTVTGLKSNKQYRFRVAALSRSGKKYVVGKKSASVTSKTIRAYKAGDTVSCEMFSFTLPAGADYSVETSDDSIAVYDREARENGWGGFAFKVTAYEDQSDYSGMMDEKIGEMTGSDGKLYDIVVQYPSEAGYDYELYGDKIPANYERLYYGADDVIKTIKAENGGSFNYGAGMKGEDLYGDVLAKHKKALDEKWDSEKLEAEDMSAVYYQLSQMGETDLPDKIGYAYRDLNGDGIDELLIGEVSKGNTETTVYDIYTVKDREPIHIASGWYRNRLSVFEDGMICNDYSESAFAGGCRVYEVVHNEYGLGVQCDFRYDSGEDEKNPWFISYGDSENYTAVTEEEFEQRKSNYGDPVHIDMTPMSSVG